MAEHSKLMSPSASALWTVCTAMPQALIDANLAYQSSADADLGTLKHEYAEQIFLGLWDRKNIPDELVNFPGVDDPVMEWNEVLIAEEAATQLLKDVSDKAYIRTEMSVAMDGWRKDCFGTSDIVCYDPCNPVTKQGKLYVVDYKFGRVRVNAFGNSQLGIYAIAAIETLEKIFPDIRQKLGHVSMGVIQPKTGRGYSASTELASAMYEWDETFLKPAQKAVLSGETKFVPGPHCSDKYCKLHRADKCPHIQQEIQNVTDEFFNLDLGAIKAEPSRDNIDFFRKLMKYDKLISKTIEKAWAVATDMALDGEKVEGFKLVLGQSRRKFKDEKDAEEFLRRKGIPKDQRYKSSLITAPQAEAVLKKEGKLDSDRTKKAFEDLIEWTEAKKVLVPEDDPREAVSFATIQDEVDEMYDLGTEGPGEDDLLDSLLQ